MNISNQICVSFHHIHTLFLVKGPTTSSLHLWLHIHVIAHVLIIEHMYMIGNKLYCSHNNALAALKHSPKCVALVLINCMIGHGHAPLKPSCKLEDETVSLFTAKSRISSILENLMFDLPEALLVCQIKN